MSAQSKNLFDFLEFHRQEYLKPRKTKLIAFSCAFGLLTVFMALVALPTWLAFMAVILNICLFGYVARLYWLVHSPRSGYFNQVVPSDQVDELRLLLPMEFREEFNQALPVNLKQVYHWSSQSKTSK